MKVPEIPVNEVERLRALESYYVLDTAAEPEFDALTRIAAHIAGVPIALVSLIDADRQWFKSRYGLEALETPREVSFCGHVVFAEAPLLVKDASMDSRFADNPLVTGEPHVKFYAGSPLTTPDGFVLGTLCVIDNHPKDLTPEQQDMLSLLADQVVAQLELRRQNQQLKVLANIVSTSFDAIMTKRLDGTILTWNQAAEDMFGYTAEEAIGENIFLLFPVDRLEEELKLVQELQAGRIVDHFETVRVCKDGRRLDVSVTLSPLYGENDKVVGASKIVRDITERKRIEQIKDEFVSTVSHELRTPLTSIRGALGLVAGGMTGELPAEAKEYVDIALNNSERLVRLINDILDIEKMKSGRLDFRFESVSIADAVTEAIQNNQAFAVEHGVSLELISSLPDGEVSVDPDRLAQVFANLISNAAKFTAAETKVEVSVERVGARCRFSIRDFGPGIPEEFRGRIFERFSQADSSSTRKKGGSGLGLAITLAVVQQMRGELRFEDAPGGGTIFSFDLPYYDAVEPMSASSRDWILVCEDDPDVSRYLSNLFESLNFLVDVAPTLGRARRLLKSKTYGAVTLDLTLADGPGTRLIGEIRTDPKIRDTPIIIVSGSCDAVEERGFIVSDVLSKPVDEDRLVLALRDAIKSSSGRISILHVEDEPDLQRILRRTLSAEWDVSTAATVAEAKRQLMERAFDVVVLDLDLPDGRGEEVLTLVGDASVIIFSASSAPEDLVGHVAGAFLKARTVPLDLKVTISELVRKRKDLA